MTRVRRLVGAAGVAASLLALAASSARAQSNRLEVTSLTFEGNSVMSSDSLSRAIVNRASECRSAVFKVLLLCPLGLETFIDQAYLQPRELDDDMLRIQAYYYLRGYRETQVDTSLVRSDRTVDITFRVDEGRPVLVDSLRVLLTEALPDSSFLDDLPLREGRPLSDLLIDAARDSVEARLKDRGYAYADVLFNYSIPADDPYSASVVLDLDPGPRARFGPIEVQENEILEEESIRRMLPFRQGERYRQSAILEGQRNLFSLDLIQSARIQARPDSMARDTVIPVDVVVSEGMLHRVSAGLGWTTADCLNAEARWASRNFYGGARRLEVRARVSNILAEQLGAQGCPSAGTGEFAELNGQLSVELFQPWIFSPRNSLSARAYIERQSLPDVFVREALGFNLAVSRAIGRRASVTLAYEPQLAQLEAAEIFFCASFLACLPSDIRVFQGASWLAPITLSAVRDRRNSVLNPSQGHRVVLGLEHADEYTGSNFAYSRVVGEATGYRPIAGFVGATRVRAGLVGNGRFVELDGPGSTDLVHPQKRFYAGGSSSVRGFAENRLGPRVLTVDVSELLGVPPVEGALEPVCVPEEIVDFGCDPSALPDGRFSPRAVGGSVVIEGNLEARFPLFVPAVQGVTFLDFGQVWLESDDVDLTDLEFAPGVGVRYLSPIGPIRIDLGYRFREGESLRVATSGVRPFDPDVHDERDRIRVRTADGGTRTLDWVRGDELTFLFRSAAFGADRSFWSRLQLHVSIGQAF